MDKLWKYIIFASAIVLAAIVLSAAVTQRYRINNGTIAVTGLGETEFTSDLIVIEGKIEAENYDAAVAYHNLEEHRNRIVEFLTS